MARSRERRGGAPQSPGAAERPDPAAGAPREPSRPRLEVIAGVAGAMVLAAILAHLVLWTLLRTLERRARRVDQPPAPVARLAPQTPEPTLETSPYGELQQVRAIEQRNLETYGWIDRSRGRVRIPIERAMELLATEGARGVARAAPPVGSVRPAARPATARRTGSPGAPGGTR